MSGPKRRGRAVPPAAYDTSAAIMTESMEALSHVAFLGLARLRRLLGDGGTVRMALPGYEGVAPVLRCTPEQVPALLEEIAAGTFITWSVDATGYISITVLPPPELTTRHP